MGFLFFYSLYLHINTAGKAIGSHDGFIIELHSVIMAWLAPLFVETNATAVVQGTLYIQRTAWFFSPQKTDWLFQLFLKRAREITYHVTAGQKTPAL